MGNNEKLSISIVTMNNMQINRNCLNSIFEQTKGVSFKVFVLDNNSSDDTVNMIRKDFPQVELIESDTNRWFTTNQNILLRKISSEYALLLNNDTVFTDNSIKTMVDFLDLNPGIGAIACKILNYDGSFQPTSLRCDYDLLTIFSVKSGLARIFPKSKICGRVFMGYADRDASQELPVYSGACVMLRKKAIDDIGLLDENIKFGPDDYDYSYRLRKKGWKIFYLPAASVIHIGNQTRKTNPDLLLEEVRGIFYFFLKHYGKFQTLILKILMLSGVLFKVIVLPFFCLAGKIKPAELKNNLELQIKVAKTTILYPFKSIDLK